MFTSHQYWEQTVGHYPVIIEKQHPPHWPLQPRSSLFVISLFTWLAILVGFRLPDILLELESCFYFLITGALTAQSADVGICRARPQIILQEIKNYLWQNFVENCSVCCLERREERGWTCDFWIRVSAWLESPVMGVQWGTLRLGMSHYTHCGAAGQDCPLWQLYQSSVSTFQHSPTPCLAMTWSTMPVSTPIKYSVTSRGW